MGATGENAILYWATPLRSFRAGQKFSVVAASVFFASRVDTSSGERAEIQVLVEVVRTPPVRTLCVLTSVNNYNLRVPGPSSKE